MYIHISSNHPSKIIKQLPNTINQRLSDNSSDEAAFNSTKVEYKDALKKSGYKVNLKYTDKTTAKPKRNRQKNTIWFNPLFNKCVRTNVAKIFFRLLDKHISLSNRLYKIFNHNQNLKSLIITQFHGKCSSNNKKHNTYVNRKKSKSKPSCNCRKKDDCPISDNCLINNVI